MIGDVFFFCLSPTVKTAESLAGDMSLPPNRESNVALTEVWLLCVRLYDRRRVDPVQDSRTNDLK